MILLLQVENLDFLEIDNTEIDPNVFKGDFYVTGYPFNFTGSSLVSDEIKFCTVSFFCPQLNVDHDRVPLSHIPLSLVQEALGGKSLQIFRDNRTFNLELKDNPDIPKEKILSFIDKGIKKERELEDSDKEWFEQSVYLPGV